MGVFADRIITTVNRLLSSKGNTAVLTKVTTGTYNPTLGTTTNTVQTVNTKYVALSNSDISESMSALMGDGMYGFSKDKVIIPAIDTAINNTWKLNDKIIVSIEKIETEDTVVAYVLKLESE